MPIDYRKYNPGFRALSREIRFGRANNRCEKCGVFNYDVGRWEDGKWNCYRLITQSPDERIYQDYATARAVADDLNEHGPPDIYDNKLRVIVLTVAHLDHDTRNDDPANLMALCQRCHLGHDRKDNAQKRRISTRERYYEPNGRHHRQIRLNLS